MRRAVARELALAEEADGAQLRKDPGCGGAEGAVEAEGAEWPLSVAPHRVAVVERVVQERLVGAAQRRCDPSVAQSLIPEFDLRRHDARRSPRRVGADARRVAVDQAAERARRIDERRTDFADHPL